MARQDVLIAAITKQGQAIGRLKAVKAPNAKQKAALATNTATFLGYVAELAGLQAPTAPTPTSAPSPSVVTPTGDAAAWDRVQAADNIKGAYERSGILADGTATPQEARAALGDGLFAQAIVLGKFGSPYWGPGDADTPLTPEEFAIGDRAGGFSGRKSGLDNKLSPGFYERIFVRSKLVVEKLTPSPMSYQEAYDLGQANGLNASEDGPK